MPDQCHRCHKKNSPAQLKFIRGRNIYVCKDCAEEKYYQCDICREYFSQHDMIYPESKNVCIWCISEKYLLCPHCNEFVSPQSAIEFHEHFMCKPCYKDYFGKCNICGKILEEDDLEDVSTDGKYYKICPACLTNYSDCVACYDMFLKTELYEVDGKRYCKTCIQGVISEMDAENRRQALLHLGAVATGLFAGVTLAKWLGGKTSAPLITPDNDCGLSPGYDDAFPDDYVGDGLDGNDDYLGDGLD